MLSQQRKEKNRIRLGARGWALTRWENRSCSLPGLAFWVCTHIQTAHGRFPPQNLSKPMLCVHWWAPHWHGPWRIQTGVGCSSQSQLVPGCLCLLPDGAIFKPLQNPETYVLVHQQSYHNGKSNSCTPCLDMCTCHKTTLAVPHLLCNKQPAISNWCNKMIPITSHPHLPIT